MSLTRVETRAPKPVAVTFTDGPPAPHPWRPPSRKGQPDEQPPAPVSVVAKRNSNHILFGLLCLLGALFLYAARGMFTDDFALGWVLWGVLLAVVLFGAVSQFVQYVRRIRIDVDHTAATFTTNGLVPKTLTIPFDAITGFRIVRGQPAVSDGGNKRLDSEWNTYVEWTPVSGAEAEGWPSAAGGRRRFRLRSDYVDSRDPAWRQEAADLVATYLPAHVQHLEN